MVDNSEPELGDGGSTCHKMNGKRVQAESEPIVGAESKPAMEVPGRVNLGTFAVLPDHLLLHVGKSILEFCGVEDFFQFARISKHIHRIMSDKDFISSTFKSVNEWLSDAFKSENENFFKHTFSCSTISLSNETIASILQSENKKSFDLAYKKGRYPEPIWSILDSENKKTSSGSMLNKNPSATTVSNFEELSLCQTVLKGKNSIGSTISPFNRMCGTLLDFDRDRYERQLNFIATTMMKHPSTMVIFDFPSRIDKIMWQLGQDLRKVFVQTTGKPELFYFRQMGVIFRIRDRLFVSEIQDSLGIDLGSDLEIQDELSTDLGTYPFCFEFGFRLGGVEVPPLRSADREKAYFIPGYYWTT